MSITVGIVFHQRPSHVPVASDGELEVLTRTNASLEGEPTPWLGFGENHNRLLQRAGGAEWYVAVSPDVTCSAEDLIHLVEAGADAGCDVVAPLIRTPWGIVSPQKEFPEPRRWLAETVRTTTRTGREANDGGVIEAAWVSGACVALRTARPEARFDPGYFMYFEDVDLCHRVGRMGGRVGVCHDVVVGHRSGWSTQDPLRFRRGVEFARGAIRFAEETGHSATAMRAAGLLRWGSRRLVPARSDSQRAAAQAISGGFARVGRVPGLSELAADFNARVS